MPATLITNEPDSVAGFASEGRTVTKVLGSNTIVEEGVRKLAFTRLLEDVDLTDLRGIEQTTHLFQRWVPKSHDSRIVMIGDALTAVAIHAKTATGHVDWRTDYDNLTYELVEPPAQVVDGVRRLMATLGLVYGALDFVISPDRRWTFLEINPGGQYRWIQDATGAPLTDQLADLLAKETW